MVLHSYGQLGVGTVACIHLVATCPNYLLANQTHLPIMEDDLLSDPLKFQDGSLSVPEGPGLGVSLDEEKVMKYEEHFRREGEYTHFTELEPDLIPWFPRS